MKIGIKYFLILTGIIFLVFAVLVLRPVPVISEDEAIIKQGIVAEINEAGTKDLVFKLENNERLFYVNRGLEMGLQLEALREKLIGQPIILKYPEYWTPLDWNDRIKHISKLEYKDKIVFNELAE